MPECYIRGSTIKYLRIPDEVIDMVKEDAQMKARNRQEMKGRNQQNRNQQGQNRQQGGNQNRNFQQRGPAGNRPGGQGGQGGQGGGNFHQNKKPLQKS